jgi:hypothetical protein
MLVMWLLTVLPLITNCVAISLLSAPYANSCSISRSRSLNSGSASAG